MLFFITSSAKIESVETYFREQGNEARLGLDLLSVEQGWGDESGMIATRNWLVRARTIAAMILAGLSPIDKEKAKAAYRQGIKGRLWK